MELNPDSGRTYWEQSVRGWGGAGLRVRVGLELGAKESCNT